MSLQRYKQKRRFDETPEPKGKLEKAKGKLQFVVQKHHASRLHYDFRLELDGVLKSWAVPKGPSMNTEDRRLAVMVEDHPVSYMKFEGTIPEGNYGAGRVIVWDIGYFWAKGATPAKPDEAALRKGIESGKLEFHLAGKRLKGMFVLIKLHGREENAWLLIKMDDEYASEKNVIEVGTSVLSSRRLPDPEPSAAKRGASKTSKTPAKSTKQAATKSSKKAPLRTPVKTAKTAKTAKVTASKTAEKKTNKLVAKSVTKTATKTTRTATKKPVHKTATKSGSKTAKSAGRASAKSSAASAKEADRRVSRAPYPIKPMLTTLVDKPFDHSDWLFEMKWDGYRAIAHREGPAIRLYSRNANSFESKFPTIAAALHDLRLDCVLDGEVVALDSSGKSSFQQLQNYLRVAEGKIRYMVFDLLFLDGYDLRHLPLLRRKELLKELVADHKLILYSDHVMEKGIGFFDKIAKRRLEGIIAKLANGPYRAGERGPDWLKIKTHQRQEAVIAGYTAPRGSRRHFGSLILGVYDKGELRYIGHTGTGFSDKALADLEQRLRPLIRKTAPFKEVPKTNTEATWLKPEIVAEVEFTEWTDSGQMRHPSFVGLREDKAARQTKVELEKPVERVVAAGKGDEMQVEPAKQPRKTADEKQEYQFSTSHTELKLTNLDKLYWPDEGITKGDLLSYYDRIADVMLPYLKNRPQSLNRHPDGIAGPNFYQKDVDYKVPSFMKTQNVYSEGNKEELTWLLCQNRESLLYIANLGCIEINPWNSHLPKLDKPDYLVIDLDPDDNTFDEVIRIAQITHRILDQLGIENHCKTSGKTGLHIFIPLGDKYTHEQSRYYARLIAELVHEQSPDNTSLERMPAKRRGKIYVDFLQNRTGQTLAAAYSVRPAPGAPVSTPLKWSEVRKGLLPSKFTIFTIEKRLARVGDLWGAVLGKAANLTAAFGKMPV